MQNGRDHKFEFQGQEIQDELGLDWISFKWRNHDPAIGRFFNIDPLAESYNYQSPYNFSENRVIDAIELEGLEAVSIHADARASFLFTGSVSAGIAFDFKGNVGAFVQPGIGFGAALGATAGGGVSFYPTANSIDDLSGGGFSIVTGGAFGMGASASFDYSTSHKAGGSFSVGVGGEIVFAGEMTLTFMEQSSWGEIGDFISNSTDEYFKAQMINGLENSVGSMSDQISNKVSAFDILVQQEVDTGDDLTKAKNVLTNEIAEMARTKVEIQNTLNSINNLEKE